MEEENSIEKFLDQIADMLALTHDNKSEPFEGKLDESIEAQLDVLEKNVELFRKITDRALQSSGVGEEMLQQNIENPPGTLSRKEKRILERTKKLKSEVLNIRNEFSRQCDIAKLQKKKAKTAGKKRKKKFKRLGGQGWMPL